MNDYISRQTMLDAVDKLKIIPSIDGTGKPTPTEDFRVQFLGTVLKAPAADVVPVRLGEWLDGYKMQTCSLCKCRGKKSWTFCPHCGARMIYGKREE